MSKKKTARNDEKRKAKMARRVEKRALLEAKDIETSSEPGFKVTVYLGSHVDKSDIRLLQSHMKQADVFAPESAHCTEAEARNNERVLFTPGTSLSRIEMQSLTPQYTDHLFRLAKLVRKEGVKPHILERHSSEKSAELRERFGRVTKLLYEASSLFLKGEFARVIENVGDSERTFYSVRCERHDEMDRRMATAYKDILAKYPELMKREVIRYLVFIGDAHEPIARKWEREGNFDIEINIAYPEIKPGNRVLFSEALERGERMDDEETILARIFLESMVKAQTDPEIYFGNSLRRAAVYEIVSDIDLESIYNFSREVVGYSDIDADVLREGLDALTSRFGNPLPKTRDDVKSILVRGYGEDVAYSMLERSS